jgi:hypothetical protein
MIRLLPRAIRKPKAIEDLQASTLQPISLAIEDLGPALVDDTCLNAETGRPGRRHHSAQQLLNKTQR